MSYAAPFSLLSWHLPDHDESVAERLRWPLAGSALFHAVVFVAVLSLRFGSSLEQSSGSYEVTLVTLPEIAASPTAAPQRKAVIPPSKAVTTTGSRPQVKPRVPQRVMDSLVNEPKLQVPAMLPKVVTQPVSTDPKPTLKQNVDKLPPPPLADDRKIRKPERVTDSLMSALDSVVVPPQAPALSQKSASVPPPVPAPVKQSSSVKMNVQPIQTPPQPPKLVVGKPEAPTPAPAPKADLLAPKLKKAVGATVVPKTPEQVSKRVSPTVPSERKRKPDAPKASESSGITLPSPTPPRAAVTQAEMQKKERPLKMERKSSTVESLKQAIQSVRIPGKTPKSKTPQPENNAVPLVSETVPPAKAAEARNLQQRKFVSPSAPELAEVQVPVPFQPTVPKAASEPDTLRDTINNLSPPELAFDAQPISKQTESGGEKARGLWKAGFCSPTNPYWENVEKKIDDIHKEYWRNIHRVESPAILTFRVMRNGHVEDLDVVQSSGNKRFDSAARDAVLAAVPLPVFPANMTKPSCQVQHVFKATLNR